MGYGLSPLDYWISNISNYVAIKTWMGNISNSNSCKQNLPSKTKPTKALSFSTWKFDSNAIDFYNYFYCDLNLFVTLMLLKKSLYPFIILVVYYISSMCMNNSNAYLFVYNTCIAYL